MNCEPPRAWRTPHRILQVIKRNLESDLKKHTHTYTKRRGRSDYFKFDWFSIFIIIELKLNAPRVAYSVLVKGNM